MNLNNKYLLTTIRILFGLFMIFAGVAGYLSAKSMVNGNPMEGVSEQDIEYTINLMDMGLLQLVKLVELVTGVMFIVNFLPALAAAMIAPLSVGFLVYNISVGSTAGTIISIIIGIINLYFAHVYWDKYKALFEKSKSKKKK